MTRILILGGGGMLGHKAYQILSRDHDVYTTFRNFAPRYRETGIFDPTKVIEGIDSLVIESVRKTVAHIRPAAILNCIGIIKQSEEAQRPKSAIQVNALFPHLLAEVCESSKIRLVHISTDCVFSGSKGGYREDDDPDPKDIYGRTKLLGEVTYGNALTLRTSIIGHELFSNRSLVDWFLSQNGKSVRGYRNAIYTGFPTTCFCREISRLVKEYPEISGLFHVASEPLSKLELLRLIRKVYQLQIDIEEEIDFQCDRSLNGELYARTTGFRPLSWEDMIREMYDDYKNYGPWRKP